MVLQKKLSWEFGSGEINGASVSIMSEGCVVRRAPSLIRLFVPTDLGSSGEPGIAKINRPISAA